MAYTEQFRAEALVALEANGGNILQTATELGIGQATLSSWLTEIRDIKEDSSDLAIASAELIPSTREEFVAELKEVRNRTLRHLSNTLEDLKPREAAVTLGILIDKTELLEGNATSRTAVVGSGETVNEAIARLRGELESRTNSIEVFEVESSTQGNGESEPTSTTDGVEQLASNGGPGIRQD
jgi:transposase-like protein